MVFRDTPAAAAAAKLPPQVKIIDLGMAALYNAAQPVHGAPRPPLRRRRPVLGCPAHVCARPAPWAWPILAASVFRVDVLPSRVCLCFFLRDALQPLSCVFHFDIVNVRSLANPNLGASGAPAARPGARRARAPRQARWARRASWRRRWCWTRRTRRPWTSSRSASCCSSCSSAASRSTSPTRSRSRTCTWSSPRRPACATSGAERAAAAAPHSTGTFLAPKMAFTCAGLLTGTCKLVKRESILVAQL